MTILRYHGFNNWQTYKEQGEDLDKAFTFGFELEVTINDSSNATKTPEELATCLKSKFGDMFVYERDGSIGNGVEIISNPMTWKYFINHLDLFKDLLKTCIDSGFDSHNGNCCGLHVHIGRKALNGLDYQNYQIMESKVIANMNFILEWFQEDIFKFSRRTIRSFQHWANPRTERTTVRVGERETEFINKDRIKHINSYDTCGRYYMLNLSNSKTVEFRFLRGTLKWETFFISMNFIKNIVVQSRISNNAITFENLVMNDLDNEMKDYAKSYCELRSIDLEHDEKIIFLEDVKRTHYHQIINEIDLANDILGA
ncbi:amidoligase family protein [Faecalicoccus acidiformans]|uniref:Amidoligase family protein n=1 Tax=Faecalicoccus acidiformans TaxID=915173 RepID=A0ABS2FLW3_9FIRM|nr:amidoligase family protein [Faecalicoccus acidiformans]MBM6831016.1 amidoligase family protein [Faecalicoccus acidiformans]